MKNADVNGKLVANEERLNNQDFDENTLTKIRVMKCRSVARSCAIIARRKSAIKTKMSHELATVLCFLLQLIPLQILFPS